METYERMAYDHARDLSDRCREASDENERLLPDELGDDWDEDEDDDYDDDL